MNLRVEKYYPILLGFIAGVLCYVLWHGLLPATTKDFLGAVVNISAILGGFLCTVWSILVSIESRKVFSLLKDASYEHLPFLYLSSAVRWLFLLALISATGLLVDFTKPPVWINVMATCWVFILVTALLSFWRLIQIFSKMMEFNAPSK
jgi:hypothetical protein